MKLKLFAYIEGIDYEKQRLGWRAVTRLYFWRIRARMYFKDKLPRNIAFRLPRRIAYWAAVRLCAQATTGKWGDTNPSQLSVMEMLARTDPGLPKGA